MGREGHRAGGPSWAFQPLCLPSPHGKIPPPNLRKSAPGFSFRDATVVWRSKPCWPSQPALRRASQAARRKEIYGRTRRIWPWVKIPYNQFTSQSPLKVTKMGGAPTPKWYHWIDPQPRPTLDSHKNGLNPVSRLASAFPNTFQDTLANSTNQSSGSELNQPVFTYPFNQTSGGLDGSLCNCGPILHPASRLMIE